MFFQNGEGVRVVRLGFSQTRGGIRESLFNRESLHPLHSQLITPHSIRNVFVRHCSLLHTSKRADAKLSVRCNYGFAFVASLRIIASRIPPSAIRFSATGAAFS
jgi:hypothetical protein